MSLAFLEGELETQENLHRVKLLFTNANVVSKENWAVPITVVVVKLVDCINH